MSYFQHMRTKTTLSSRLLPLAHGFVWALLTLIPLTFNVHFFGVKLGLFRTLVPTACLLVLFYGNAYFTQRYSLRRENFKTYHLFLIYGLIIPPCFIAVEYLFVMMNKISGIDVYLTFEIWKNGALLESNRTPDGVPRSAVGFAVILIMFMSFLYGAGQSAKRRNEQEAALRATNLRNELKLLRRQINPHFLFNALNNLYAIVQLEPHHASEFVLKLSNMLRYVTYNGQQERVSLRKELDYLQNYLYFQQWRDKDFQQLTVELPEEIPDIEVEPMLVLPFVENAFKHSYDPHHPKKRWIKLSLRVENDHLHFEVTNSRSSNPTEEEVPDEYTGIGIENVQKRLELLYPGQHQLVVQSDDHQFRIALTVPLTSIAVLS